jgi:hypothetical protein
MVSNSFGCSNTSDTVQVTGIGSNLELSGIHIHPNPANGKVTISFGAAQKRETVTVEVLNTVGDRVLGPVKTRQNELVLNLEGLNKGLYMIKVSINGRRHTERLVIE